MYLVGRILVNGAGGDGGVEAYAARENGNIIGLQAKWFLSSINGSQIKQTEKSIRTAKEIRPELSEYIICIPRDTQSKKKGKGGLINPDTEEQRLSTLVNDIETEFTDLKIQIWKRSRLITELRHAENEGLIKLWFEKEELSIETLQIRLKVAKAGWLSDRYFPDLHNQGDISKVIHETLISETYLQKQANSIQEMIGDLKKAILLIKEYCRKNKIDTSLNDDLKKVSENLLTFRSAYEKLKEEVKHNCFFDTYEIEEVNLYPVYNKLSQAKVPNILKDTHRRLKNILLSLHQAHLSQYINDIRKFLEPHNYIILGPVGSGKTHAMAFEVEKRLSLDQPALLIRAKDCFNLSWKSILADSMQACSDWSDIQILSALTSLARTKSVALASKKRNKYLNNSVKFLICIDGIDESPNPEKWKDLINETKVWLELFPDIRFVFTCRNYPSENQNPFSLPSDDNKIYRKDIYSGDSVITFGYLDHFKIKYTNTPWIINSFENGLSVRLFCEEYAGKDLSKVFKNPVFNSSKKLLEHKIQRLETEFFKKLNENIGKNERIVNNSLHHISRYFMIESKINKNKLRNSLYNDLGEVLNKKEIGLLLDLLTDNGFLICHSYSDEDDAITNEFYETGIQSYFDFLLAQKFAKDIFDNKFLEIPLILLHEKYGYVKELVALALATDYGMLIGRDNLWTSNFSGWEILQMQFKVFSLAPKALIDKYESYLKRIFLNDRDRFIEHFVFPNSSREDINVIENLVHPTLLEFSNTYERDLFWSGPDKHEIEGHSHLSFCFEYRTLYYLSKFNQEPLLYAWALSTVSNPIREKIKNELTTWALKDLKDFVHLLNKLFFECNDDQIREGLATVIYGLSSLISTDTPHTSKLIDWIQDNIFHPDQIIKLNNSLVRHSCRCLIEKTYKLGLCSKETLDSSIPPYSANHTELLVLSTKDRILMDGIYPIQHDLYWNTIEEAYKNFVDYEDGHVCQAMNILLNQHNVSNISPKEFFTRVAIEFLKDLGWNKGSGYGDVGNGQFMTFEEKYTFLAVHYIQGYLADRLPYIEYQKKRMLDDYNQILHINNPAYEELIKIEYLSRDSIKWFVPEDIAPIIITSAEKVKEDIKQWTAKAPKYHFEKWLFPYKLNLLSEDASKVRDKWFILNSYLALSDPNNIGRAWLDINCLLLVEGNYIELNALLSNNVKDFKLDTQEFKAGISGHVYNSLIDVVWRDNIKEYQNEINLVDDVDTFIQAHPTVTKVSENSLSKGDIYHNIPSAKLRQMLDITATDKTSYYDKKGTIKVINFATHEDNSNFQKMLLADKYCMETSLAAAKLKPVWICKEFRSTMNQPIIEENNAHWQNCRIWIVTKENSRYRSFLVHNDYYSNN
ncbi:hypothetical protein [Sphingobacterium suaedae]|uniref:NACHT domain-containing protein n=1 Tax=Sphingobacterium suaedae TaxID=1686402 RepID=A0ABW5KKX0_9SPHI